MMNVVSSERLVKWEENITWCEQWKCYRMICAFNKQILANPNLCEYCVHCNEQPTPFMIECLNYHFKQQHLQIVNVQHVIGCYTVYIR